MQPSTKDRMFAWPKWERHGAGHPYAEYPDPTSVVIIRDKNHPDNISGSDEQFIPSRLLYGIVPSALLDTHLFWQDKVSSFVSLFIEPPHSTITYQHSMYYYYSLWFLNV